MSTNERMFILTATIIIALNKAIFLFFYYRTSYSNFLFFILNQTSPSKLTSKEIESDTLIGTRLKPTLTNQPK